MSRIKSAIGIIGAMLMFMFLLLLGALLAPVIVLYLLFIEWKDVHDDYDEFDRNK